MHRFAHWLAIAASATTNLNQPAGSRARFCPVDGRDSVLNTKADPGWNQMLVDTCGEVQSGLADPSVTEALQRTRSKSKLVVGTSRANLADPTAKCRTARFKYLWPAVLCLIDCAKLPRIEGQASMSSGSVALADTNIIRQRYGSASVGWDNTAAAYAQKAAEACTFAHTHGYYGENLYAGTAGPANWTTVISAWASEAPAYHPNEPDLDDQDGHFTQLVWKGSKYIGCAWQQCSSIANLDWAAGGFIYYCEYNPPGNIASAVQIQENVGG
ncbi:hypothetical protein WJX84_009366 [Apatococcus fuscideae]|uniref:SCP domain-containing protein n=1 Tax=Apatococcus fuscideae TaxID=2026836 RepID=A0AAW1T2N7_9CHLO